MENTQKKVAIAEELEAKKNAEEDSEGDDRKKIKRKNKNKKNIKKSGNFQIPCATGASRFPVPGPGGLPSLFFKSSRFWREPATGCSRCFSRAFFLFYFRPPLPFFPFFSFLFLFSISLPFFPFFFSHN
jgi:hypothetical protein